MRRSNVCWQLSDEEKEEIYFDWLQKTVKNPEGLIDYYMTHLNLEL